MHLHATGPDDKSRITILNTYKTSGTVYLNLTTASDVGTLAVTAR
jgi:hypothetical protein